MAKKKMNVQSNSTKSKKRRILDSIAIIVLSCVIVVSVFGYLTLNKILETSDDFEKELLNGAQPTILLDSEGKTYHELSGGDGYRENTTIDQVPQVVIDAFLAVEDSRYYKHNGFDLPRFMKSLLENIKAGGFAQGGSTLTMQMIDVSHGTTSDDQSTVEKLIAKIQEIFLALDAESLLSKDEILMKYLNLINFGGPARGIQKGALYYFGKDISDVNLSEAAFLAGVINAPNAYNPYLNYENAVARRNNSLDLMKMHGYISETEWEVARNTELAFQLNGTAVFEGMPKQAFTDYLADWCKENLDLDIYEGNLRIHTTMNTEVQETYDMIMNGEYGIFTDQFPALQAGSAIIDVTNGSVVALSGGRNYTGDLRNNYGYSHYVNTGSSIKPLLDYTLAFEYLGWATDQIVADIPMNYRGTNIAINNASGTFHGDVPIADAIGNSWNTPAIGALQSVSDTIGPDKIIETMRKLGLSAFFDLENLEFTMGIGGGSMTSTPLEMASAYATLANGGKHIEPYPVTRIEFLDGRREDYVHEPVSEQVFSPQASYLMTDLLITAVNNYPTLQSIMRSSYQVATKTGTSDWGDAGLQYGIPETAGKDSWMISYTSKYAIGTWVGFHNPQDGYLTMNLINQNHCGKINRKMFDILHKNERPANFKQPSGVVSITHLKGAFDNGHYAVPKGTPSNMISKGLVKSEFASLKTLSPNEIKSLAAFTATVNPETQLLDFTFTPYPESEALKEFNGKYNGVPGYPKYSGKKIFSKSAVFGPIIYVLEAEQNGAVETHTYSVDAGNVKLNITPGEPAKVCGFYKYKNFDATSNKVCVELTAEQTSGLGKTPIPEVPPVDPNTPVEPTDPTE